MYPQLLEEREQAKRRYGRSRWVALWSGLLTLLRGGSVMTLELQGGADTRVVRTRTLFVGNNELQLRAVGVKPLRWKPVAWRPSPCSRCPSCARCG